MKHLILATTAAALLLAACGGGGDDAPVYSDAAPGEVHDAPADRMAHTLSGLYLSATQADRMEQSLDGRVLRVPAQPGDDDTLMRDVGLALAEQAARDLPNDVPVLVGGADLRRASELVDRLSFAGLKRVYLVTG